MTEIVQGSDAWRHIRLGKVTGSRISDVMAKGKGGSPSRTRANYLAELALERLTNQPTESFTSSDMARGTELEPQARNMYAFISDAEVKETGFVHHPEIEMAGCSPDGLIGLDGGTEFKCPKPANHLEILMQDRLPPEYVKQVQWNMRCCERDWWDFVSYCPAFPAEHQLFVKRVQADHALHEAMDAEVNRFLNDLSAAIEFLNQRLQQRRAA